MYLPITKVILSVLIFALPIRPAVEQRSNDRLVDGLRLVLELEEPISDLIQQSSVIKGKECSLLDIHLGKS